jgi:hypothetical protein
LRTALLKRSDSANRGDNSFFILALYRLNSRKTCGGDEKLRPR